MMSHPITEELSAYLDGELEQADRAAVEAHLPSCEECRGTLAALRATAADLALLADVAPREQDSWALRSAIAKARKPAGNRLWQAAAAIGSVAAVLVGFLAFSGGDMARDGGVPFGAGAMSDNALTAESLAGGTEFSQAVYDDQSAVRLLDGGESDVASAPVQAGRGRTKSSPDSFGADEIDWNAAISRCEATILEGSTQPYAPERYLVADFRDQRAMFLIYRVGDPVERRELWVLSPEQCSILHFSQRNAR